MISASARAAERMLSPAGSGSLDQPDRLHAVTPAVSTLAARAGAASRHAAAAMPRQKSRMSCVLNAIPGSPSNQRPAATPSGGDPSLSGAALIWFKVGIARKRELRLIGGAVRPLRPERRPARPVKTIREAQSGLEITKPAC